MKRFSLICVIIISLFFSYAWQVQTKRSSACDRMRPWILSELSKADLEILNSLKHISQEVELKKQYHTTRKHYKHVEFFVEYCSPLEAKYFINGPLVPKHDNEFGNTARPPQGFQRIEELLFSPGKQDTTALINEYKLLHQQLIKLSDYYSAIELPDEIMLEMCQLEIFRIATMNLSVYDATINQTGVQESAWCIEGIEKIIKQFGTYNSTFHSTLLTRLASAEKYLSIHPDYNSFNRMEFILLHVNKINATLVEFHNTCKLPWSTRRHALNLEKKFLFGKESFNPRYFSIYYDDTLHLPLQAQLGKMLFFDPVLSNNNTRSCASCHNPVRAFTDGLPKSFAIDHSTFLPRNTPTLINVAFQKAFFHDGRAYQLEQQVSDVIQNPNEMHSNLDESVKKLQQSLEYRALFTEAFRGTADTLITNYSVQKAITEYEKTLVSFNSTFDKHLRGKKLILSEREINGFNIFSGKALCGSCHFLPLFNGTVPPFFSDSEFEVIGTPATSTNKSLDTDKGRYEITHVEEQAFAFKTPTVRNIALTAPYMHNGIYNSLEQVIEFYHKGGGAGLGFEIPNQTLPFDSLKLSNKEKEDIVLFLKTLTDTSGIMAVPQHLPRFDNNILLNRRKIGGDY